jgi:hypothetical protein
MEKEIVSIFTVTDYRTLLQKEEAIIGDGQEAIEYLRTQYPRYTKFVLEGFEIDGAFMPLYIKSRNYD